MLTIALAALAFAACGKHPSHAVAVKELEVKLSAEPQRMSMAERERFTITLSATNHGKELVKPELHLVDLDVDGERSDVWMLAVGNGKRPMKWSELPAGESVSQSWSMLGSQLFPRPGRYTLVPRHEGHTLPAITVEVTP